MILRPSAAYRFLTCPASISREKDAPQTTSEAAEQGTAAHWVCECVLNSIKLPIPGDLAPNGVEVDSDMINAGYDYLNYIKDNIGFENMEVERQLSMSLIYDDMKGTADFIRYDGEVLDVLDYKYGYRMVDPLYNPQLELYGIGAIEHYDIKDRNTPVRLHIYQPRAYHPAGPGRVYETTVGDLLTKAMLYKMMIEQALSNGENRYQTGDHCTFCAARPNCSAYITACLNAVDFVGNLNEAEINNDYLAVIINNLQIGQKRIESMLTNLEETAIAKIQSGELVSGYRLGSGRGSKVWNIDADQVIAIGAMLDADFSKPGTITPTQASKLVDDSVIKHYITNKPGSAKLIKDDQSIARLAFKPLK